MTRLLIAASGTGGHLFPALAVAEAVEERWLVLWVGVPDRLETQLVPERFGLVCVNAGGLQGRGLTKLLQLLRLLLASVSVRRVIRRNAIDVVFTTGGYIAAPAILAARWCGIPVVLHESNAIPGRVTRLLGRFCSAVAIGLPAAAKRIPGSQPVLTGTPVRSSFLAPQALPSWVPHGAGPLLVVMGGIQGAVGLNRMVRAAVPALLEQGCRVVHLTGDNDPDIEQLQHLQLVERRFSDEIPGCEAKPPVAVRHPVLPGPACLHASGREDRLLNRIHPISRPGDVARLSATRVAPARVDARSRPHQAMRRRRHWPPGVGPLPEGMAPGRLGFRRPPVH